MTADLSALIARLEAEKVGSRWLDAVIWYALFEPDVDYPGIRTVETEQGPREALTCELGSKWADDVGHYTTSLDAALALAERVLPTSWMGLQQRTMGWSARIAFGGDPESVESCAITPALALCIAILRAKQGGGA